MISLTINKNEITFNGKGKIKEICTEDLAGILAIRDNLAENLTISKERANCLVIDALHEEE